MIWAPYTTTNGQWIANKILQGFFGAPIESLCEISVTDIYFTHERGTYMGLYAFFLAGSNFFAPVIAGYIADGQSWEWVLVCRITPLLTTPKSDVSQYWCAIFCGIGFVFLFFFMEETNFHRGTITGQEISSKTPLSASGTQTPSSPIDDGDENPIAQTSDPEKSPAKTAVPTTSAIPSPTPKTETKSYLARLRLFAPHTFSRPLIYLTFPVIAYAGFSYGSNLVWFNVLNGTASLILSGKPYSFAPSIVGLSYISPLVGLTLSSLYTGPFGSRFVVWCARRNKGIMEPEHRLWLFCASLVLIPFGLLLWGVGAAHGVHWFGLVFAMGVIAAANTIGLQISVSYCIDSYKDLSGEAIITVILIRNTMSFAIGTYGLFWSRSFLSLSARLCTELQC